MKRIINLFLISLIVFSSCSRKKNTALARAFHNTTSHYNGYFNAREIVKEKERELRDNFKDDYSQLLPIFIYPDEEKSQELYPDMDKVIEKCSEVIERHSIYKKKKEHIKWIDDSYFLIGKARFYKGEVGLAEQTFLYVYQAYKKDPARYKGLNWLIKTFIETRQFDKAEEFIDLVEDEGNRFPEEYRGHFNAIYADYHIKKDKDYERAIEHLEEAVRLTKEKEFRRRYTYILAQLYQKQNNFSLASDRYARVLKLNPDYIMRFNARISRAIAYDVSANNSDAIKKELRKMLKDVKNEEFRDQIYYALAELALKEDDEPLAIDYLRKSTRYSVTNNKQKGLSYLKLANIFFEQPNYISAQENYDSTLQFLPEDHPDYYEAEEKNNSLQELVKNLKTIELQDSLLQLSNLSEKEQKKKVKALIKSIKDEEERKKQEQLQLLQSLQSNSSGDLINTAARSGSRAQWYFYNPNTLSIGLSEFKNTWGDRPLADNWRRSNRNATVIVQNNPLKDETEESESVAPSDSTEQETKYDIDTYLKDIPKDIQEQLEAHGKIADALFNVGTIFKESFTDYKSAIASFERITKEYDTSKHNLPAHYQLYRIYLINQETELAEKEKEWVLDNHPFSEYAYLIKNPEYNKQSKETKEKVEEFYAATYRLFKYKLYNDVIESCIKADNTFSANHIQAQFDLLKAKSIGHTKSREEFKASLEKIVADHPEDPVKDEAQFILDYMKGMNQGKSTAKKESIFNYNPKDVHLFILSAKKGSKNFNSIKNQLANFNKEFFRENKLQLTSSTLKDNDIYLIRSFPTEKEATRYLKTLKNNKSLAVMINQANASQYIISNTNFRTLFKKKNEKEYLAFFKKKYTI